MRIEFKPFNSFKTFKPFKNFNTFRAQFMLGHPLGLGRFGREKAEGIIRLSSIIVLIVNLVWVGTLSAADKLRIGYSGATVSNAMLW
jgi:hypothetical protein